MSATRACGTTALCVSAVAELGVTCAHTLTLVHAHTTQVRRGDVSAATEGVQEGRVSTARDIFGLDDAQTTVSSSTDTMFSTLRRLAKVVVSLGQVIASFTRV